MTVARATVRSLTENGMISSLTIVAWIPYPQFRVKVLSRQFIAHHIIWRSNPAVFIYEKFWYKAFFI